ncbi:hypothetical protein BJ508DRAFT_23862 [Ascobolus immersus RN42]|uniref:Cyanovirin-N domain-containing protein n=1 Tax=Ascobolus immersus RN42 TaxID=1160509 RepID=A0A3N4HMW2_ASCIM|nr:hypothetical protein BJ508DRAFT_23862 [Ascobolus immersus RN42]
MQFLSIITMAVMLATASVSAQNIYNDCRGRPVKSGVSPEPIGYEVGRMDENMLLLKCKVHGTARWQESRHDLNLCVANAGGRLESRRDGGFYASCRNCRMEPFKFATRRIYLACQCDDGRGGTTRTKLNMRSILSTTSDGFFGCHGHRSAPYSSNKDYNGVNPLDEIYPESVVEYSDTPEILPVEGPDAVDVGEVAVGAIEPVVPTLAPEPTGPVEEADDIVPVGELATTELADGSVEESVVFY